MILVCRSLNLIYLCSLLIIPCVGQEQYYITRTTVGSQKDLFIIPRCSQSPLTCSALYYGASNHDPTQCKCACRYEYSTFGYYNGRWVCLDNTKVRRQPGCQFLFDGEGNHQPLKVLSSGSSRRVIFPSFSCTIDQSASLYRKCDGTWAAVDTQLTMFSLIWQLTENLGRGRYRYTMKVGTATSLAGRLVRLKVNCTNPSRSSCVLFKIAGQINCPVNIVRSSTTQTPTVTVTHPPTTQLFSSKTPIRNNSTEVPGPAVEEASNSDQSGGSSGTVAAVVIIIILVIIVAAIAGFVIWKRRRGGNILLVDYMLSIATKVRSPQSTKKPVEHFEERIYAEIPERPALRQTANTPSASHYAEIYSVAYQDPNLIHATPKQQNNTISQKIPDEGPTDERGYMVPVDSPLHSRVQDNSHQNTDSYARNKNPIRYDKRRDPSRSSTHEVGEGNNYAVPHYDILEESDKQYRINKDKASVYTRQPNSPSSVWAGSSTASPSAGPATDGAGENNRCLSKKRRTPPSPPRKI